MEDIDKMIYVALLVVLAIIVFVAIVPLPESVKQEICNRDNCATFKEIETNDMCLDELCEIIEEEK